MCPARGDGSALVLPPVNVDAMNKYLAGVRNCVSAIALLIRTVRGW
jgi:hypothetical protein